MTAWPCPSPDPVLCKNSFTSSRHPFRIVVIQQSTQRRLSTHRSQRRWRIRILKPQRDDVIQALMRSLPVVMVFDLFEHVAQTSFAQENQLVQRISRFPHKPLRVSVTLPIQVQRKGVAAPRANASWRRRFLKAVARAHGCLMCRDSPRLAFRRLSCDEGAPESCRGQV